MVLYFRNIFHCVYWFKMLRAVDLSSILNGKGWVPRTVNWRKKNIYSIWRLLTQFTQSEEVANRKQPTQRLMVKCARYIHAHAWDNYRCRVSLLAYSFILCCRGLSLLVGNVHRPSQDVKGTDSTWFVCMWGFAGTGCHRLFSMTFVTSDWWSEVQ